MCVYVCEFMCVHADMRTCVCVTYKKMQYQQYQHLTDIKEAQQQQLLTGNSTCASSSDNFSPKQLCSVII